MLTPMNVLLVEDSEDDAILLIRTLRKGGFEPDYLRVETAREMSGALYSKPWDVILCDFKLPEFGGLNAIALLKETQLDIPILIVSGSIGEEMAVECMRRGANDYIMKDNLSRLCPAIMREIADAQSRAKRRQTEAALVNSEENYRRLFESNPHPMWVYDIETLAFLAVNDAAVAHYGYSRQEFLKMTICDIRPPEDIPKLMENIAGIQQGIDKAGVWQHRKKDGSIFFVEITSHTQNYNGKSAELVLSYDITEKLKIQEALRQSEEKFKTIANYTIDWESWFAPDGTYLWVNPAVERITGYTADEVLAMPDFISVMIVKEDREALKTYFQKALTGTRGENYELRYRHKSGAVLWLSLSWQPVYDALGLFLGIRTSGRDITALKQADVERRNLEKQLFQAQKMEAIGTLAGGIAHDFNNILSGIIGYAELIAMQADDLTRKSIRQILIAAERARNLIKQIMAFSRHVEPDKKPMDFRNVIGEALKLLRATISTKIEMRIELPDEPVIVDADYTQMHQVIMNIGTNAVHAMGEKGGRISVTLVFENIQDGSLSRDLNLAHGLYAKLSITDTGQGIEPVHMSRLFDPFFTTKKVGEGTGLGLAVVYGIVHDHAGGVGVSSLRGQGATFNVYLPAIGNDQITQHVSESKIIPRGHERILFVDDEPDLVDLGCQILSSLGYQVTVCSESPEALSIYSADPGSFDLVITDMNMPSMSGAELACEILKLRRDQAIILCTGYSDYMDSEKAAAIGIRSFVMKPLTREILAVLVRKVLDNHAGPLPPV